MVSKEITAATDNGQMYNVTKAQLSKRQKLLREGASITGNYSHKMIKHLIPSACESELFHTNVTQR